MPESTGPHPHTGAEGSESTSESGADWPVVDTTTAHPARIYDYLLGGKDNFEVDRAAAERFTEMDPRVRAGALANRKFMVTAVRGMTAVLGLRQFLDLGSGVPTSPNVHEVAQEFAPESRVVYVDHDPVVITHARALLDSTRQGATAYIEADLRNLDAILVRAADTLDLTQPVGVIILAVLHRFLTTSPRAWSPRCENNSRRDR